MILNHLMMTLRTKKSETIHLTSHKRKFHRNFIELNKLKILLPYHGSEKHRNSFQLVDSHRTPTAIRACDIVCRKLKLKNYYDKNLQACVV